MHIGVQGSNTRKPLGKILLKQKLVSEEELEEQLEKQRLKPGGDRLASTLAQSGKVADVHLLKALSEQLGVPAIDLAQVMIPLSNLSIIPIEVARQHLILPILIKENEVHLAMADPNNRRMIEEIEFISGKKVFPYVALQHSINEVISYAYRIAAEGKEFYTGPFVPRNQINAQISSTEIQWKIGVMSSQLRLCSEVQDAANYANLSLVTFSADVEAIKHLAADPGLILVLEVTCVDPICMGILQKIREDEPETAIERVIVVCEDAPWRMAHDIQRLVRVKHVLGWPLQPDKFKRCINRLMYSNQEVDALSIAPEVAQAIDTSMRAFKRGEPAVAIAGLLASIIHAPDSFELHYNLGLLYGHQRRISDAIRELTLALDIRPHDFSVLRNLAVLYQNQGFTRMALEYWEHALCYAPAEELKAGLHEHIASLLLTDEPS